MSTVERLLDELSNLDVAIIPCGDRIKINAPKGVLTPELIDRIRRNKSEILADKKTHTNKISPEKDRHHRHHRHSGGRLDHEIVTHGWDPETAALIQWFTEDGQYRIPDEPFRLSSWQLIVNPQLFRETLLFGISMGPEKTHFRHGTFKADLRRLKELFGEETRSEENNS